MTNPKDILLTDESIYPDENILKDVLGRSHGAYLALLNLYVANELNPEWRYYKDGKAWLCKVQKKKKTIVWISVWKGYVQTVIYVRSRLLEELLKLNISDETKNRIIETKNVGQSKPCIFEVKNQKSIKDFEKVMQFKICAK